MEDHVREFINECVLKNLPKTMSNGELLYLFSAILHAYEVDSVMIHVIAAQLPQGVAAMEESPFEGRH